MNKACLHQLKAYQFDLHPSKIAQEPSKLRDGSRLMLVDRRKKTIEVGSFCDLFSLLQAGDQLILNDTQVIPARIFAKKNSGAKFEFLLLNEKSPCQWYAMGKPLKKLKQGQVLFFEGDVQATVESVGQKQVLLSFLLPYRMSFFTWLNQYGHMPLPPYIHRNKRLDMDKDRYQTVFASKPGAVAAPTAALHFSEESFNTLAKKGVENVKLSLHVGAGTFQPVQCEDLTKHPMHKEWFNLSHQGAYQLNKSVRRRICVGTTCCRTLESIADPLGRMKAQKGWTDIFIYPGYSFKFVDALLTNFHLPGSTLLMLVCALGGYDLIMQAYQKAIDEGFRFYSYGDAMLIL